jgi:hypothetical protein
VVWPQQPRLDGQRPFQQRPPLGVIALQQQQQQQRIDTSGGWREWFHMHIQQ